MRFLQLVIGIFASLLAIPSAVASPQTYPSHPKCKAEDIVYRKEWRTLSESEQKNYIDAVRCLQTKRPSFYKDEIKGAQSRFDDFQIVHIEQTFIIHFNAQFLGWHRWFIWKYEQTLKNECGYKGAHPYWDWTLDAANVAKSPLFENSPSSFGGNGKSIPHKGVEVQFNLPPAPESGGTLPPGSGGGCVTTGPFANHIVNFGPIKAGANYTLYNNPNNLAHKPHCLFRDFNQAISGPSVTQKAVDILLSQPDIAAFTDVMNFGTVPGVQGVHGGGHISVGGDMTDFFSSPGDPLFFVHHAQIDRLWALWQNKDLKHREYAISGTGTFLNYPPSPKFKLGDKISLGRLSPEGPQPLCKFMSTQRGPLCYAYK